jgi:hypothetical protein
VFCTINIKFSLKKNKKKQKKTHKSTNRKNQSTTGKLRKQQWPLLGTGISKEMVG